MAKVQNAGEAAAAGGRAAAPGVYVGGSREGEFVKWMSKALCFNASVGHGKQRVQNIRLVTQDVRVGKYILRMFGAMSAWRYSEAQAKARAEAEEAAAAAAAAAAEMAWAAVNAIEEGVAQR